MEANPLEAVRNNALVTRTVADVAVEFGAERFVLVSTDKAVNAKTVMGQSKALCEWIVEAGATVRTRDALLRRPLRQRPRVVRERDPDLPQADRARRAGHGDPPEMTRYFMTIPEAVQLVIQAGAIGAAARCTSSTWASPCASSTSRTR